MIAHDPPRPMRALIRALPLCLAAGTAAADTVIDEDVAASRVIDPVFGQCWPGQDCDGNAPNVTTGFATLLQTFVSLPDELAETQVFSFADTGLTRAVGGLDIEALSGFGDAAALIGSDLPTAAARAEPGDLGIFARGPFGFVMAPTAAFSEKFTVSGAEADPDTLRLVFDLSSDYSGDDTSFAAFSLVAQTGTFDMSARGLSLNWAGETLALTQGDAPGTSLAGPVDAGGLDSELFRLDGEFGSGFGASLLWTSGFRTAPPQQSVAFDILLGDGPEHFFHLGMSGTAALGGTLDLFGSARLSAIQLLSGGSLVDGTVNGLIGGDYGGLGMVMGGGVLPPDPPAPGVIPLPAAGWLLIGGLGMLAALRRRRGA